MAATRLWRADAVLRNVWTVSTCGCRSSCCQPREFSVWRRPARYLKYHSEFAPNLQDRKERHCLRGTQWKRKRKAASYMMWFQEATGE